VASSSPARRGGRPRDPDVDEKVRQATIAVLVEDGYAAVTMEGIARRAGVAHTTVYRRWPSKAHLVHDVLFPAEEVETFTIEPGASVTAVVTGLVAGIVENFSRPEARAGLPGLMIEYPAAGSLAGRLWERFETPITRSIDDFFAEAAARGEARPSADASTLLSAIMGFALISNVLYEDRSNEDRVSELVDLVLDGILDRPGGPTSST
jgi:AcrR family transcriptional regulator